MSTSAAIALESADLNGDGRADYVLVLERPLKGDEVDPIRHRPLLLLIRSLLLPDPNSRATVTYALSVLRNVAGWFR